MLLSAEITEPKGTKEELAKVKDLLSSYSTNFRTSGAARVTNINVATDRINGTVLYPGEEFSVNETIQQEMRLMDIKKPALTRAGRPFNPMAVVCARCLRLYIML